MRTFKIVKIIIYSILLLDILSSCKKENKTDFETFIIKVDSIQLPDHILANEPFNIDFYGTVGPSGCFQFSQFKTERQNNDIMVEVWGKFVNNSQVCPTVMVYLDGEELNYTIEKPGNYTLKIKQTEDSYLEQQISVE